MTPYENKKLLDQYNEQALKKMFPNDQELVLNILQDIVSEQEFLTELEQITNDLNT